MVTLKPNCDDVLPSLEDVSICLGYHRGSHHDFAPLIENLIQRVKEVIDISCGYVLIENVTTNDDSLVIANEQLNIGITIMSHFPKVTSSAIFLATLGSRFDQFMNQFFSNNDPFNGYIVDTIGSLAVENVVDYLADYLSRNSTGLGVTNRFSPGYCGWDVIEQHKLFKLLPQNFCGVKLNESALMTPIKSVSGIIGLGDGVNKREYTCNDCETPTCIKRKD